MEIEKDEYFVVSRGFAYNMDWPMSFFGGFGEKPPPPKEQRYDRSYAGMIFRAESSAYPMVACICVGSVAGSICNHEKEIKKPFMFNQQEVELMVVSKDFVDKCVPNNAKEKTNENSN